MEKNIDNFISDIRGYFLEKHKVDIGTSFKRILNNVGGENPINSIQGNNLFFERHPYIYGQVHCYYGNIIGKTAHIKGKKFIGERLDLYLLEFILPLLKEYKIKTVSFGGECYFLKEDEIYLVTKHDTGLLHTEFDLQKEIKTKCKVKK